MEQNDPLSKLIRAAGRREPVPAEARARVLAAVRSEWKGTVRRRNVRRWSVWLSSTVAAGVMAGLLLTYFRGVPEAPGVAAVAFVEGRPFSGQTALNIGAKIQPGSVVSTSAQDRVSLTLSGGQSLRLDRSSRVKFISAEQMVLEAGAIYADSNVTPGIPKTSLEIRTDAGVVRNLGTQFEVREQADGVRIRVREGTVSLEQKSGKTQAGVGEQLSAANLDAPPVRSTVPPDHPDWQWASTCAPAFELDGATLPEFLKWAAREQGLKVEFASAATREAISGVKLHGNMQGMTPQEALDSVLPASGLSYHVHAGVLTVSLER